MKRRAFRLIALSAALLSATLWAVPPAAADPGQPPAFVVDTDMDFDDTAALAYLAEADRLGLVDLRGVSVESSGIAFPGTGLSHARCLLDKLGLPDVPAGDGDLVRPNNFPDFARVLLDGIVESGVGTTPDVACPQVPSEGHAADLLLSAIRSAPGQVTLVTLGPLTNVAEALRRDPSITGKIGRVFVGGGTLDWSTVPTSGLDTHDYNIWVDAPAAQSVLDAFSGRVFMSGEATGDVPLTEAFRLRLGADCTTPAARTVYTMASDPILISTEADNQGPNSPGVAAWWDPVSTVQATFGGIVRHREVRVRVVQDGEHEGLLLVDDDGPLVHFGKSTKTDAFEQTFLDLLNARYPAR